MKHTDGEPLAFAVGRLLGRRLRTALPPGSVEWVVPIPMHWTRRLRRGTQPSRVLAGEVAARLQVRVGRRLLVCRRKTRKQGTLRPTERRRNMRYAFRISSGYDITDAQILLIDDVMTTGATVNEAARILLRAGARRVIVAVVARGTGTT